MKKIKFNFKDIYIISAIILIALNFGFSYSKYVLEKNDNHVQESTAFYFETDISEAENIKSHKFIDWTGSVKEFEFSIENYVDMLRYTNEDIYYNIEIEKKDMIDIELIEIEDFENKTGKVINQSSKNLYSNLILTGGAKVKKNYILKMSSTAQIENNIEDNVTIKIKTTSPYEKELKSNVILKNTTIENEINIISENEKEYGTLTMKINRPTSKAIIIYNSQKLILDKSNYLVCDVLENNLNESQKKFSITDLDIDEIYKIYFIKLQNNIDNNDIEVNFEYH